MWLMEVGVCTSLAGMWQIIGKVLFAFKIAIPIIIIIFGMIDLGKAVVASKDDEIKKSVKSLAFRAAAGVIIFFIPSLISVVLGLVGSFKDTDYQAEYAICRGCITSPNNAEKCISAAESRCTGSGGTWESSDGSCTGAS